MKIKDLQVNQPFEQLTVEIVSKGEPRAFSSPRGSGSLCKMAVRDDSGEVSLTLWNDDIKGYEEGDVLVIKDGWCSEFRGEKQISRGKKGTITKA
jgi:ssDNA-binding replication factor A large subunit